MYWGQNVSTSTTYGTVVVAQRHEATKRHLIERVDRDRIDTILGDLHLIEGIEDVANEAYSIVKKVADGFSRGRNVEALMAATVYAACRRLSVPINLNDICRCSNANRRLVRRFYRRMLAEGIVDVPGQNYSLHLDRLIRKLEAPHSANMHKEILTNEVRLRALQIIERARSQGITGGRNPASLAAASLYVACDRRISQRELAEAAGVSEVTVRGNYKQLRS